VPLPEEQSTRRGQQVQQLHPFTKEVMSVICRDFQASHASIQKACRNGSMYKDFRWRLV